MATAHLSKTEKVIVGAMEAEAGRQWTLDELAKIVYKRRRRPEHWRNSLATMMRILHYKTLLSTAPISRASKLGRGNKAVYAVERLRKRRGAFLSDRMQG